MIFYVKKMDFRSKNEKDIVAVLFASEFVYVLFEGALVFAQFCVCSFSI